MKPLLNKRQAAEYLNISERTLDYFRQRGNLPYHVLCGECGKLVRFDERELEFWATGRNLEVTDDTIKTEADYD